MNILQNSNLRLILIVTIVFPITWRIIRRVREVIWELISFILEWIIDKCLGRIKHALTALLSARRYCKIQLKGNSKELNVPAKIPFSLNTDTAFVPLVFEKFSAGANNCSQDEVLELGNRVLIIGDPGAGKSSLIKKLFRDSCRKVLKKTWKSEFPIFFELKNVEVPADTTSNSNWILEQIRIELMNNGFYKIDECLDSYCKLTGVLFFLDGLDEVSKKHYPEVKKAILKLSNYLKQHSHKNRLIITLRSQFYHYVKDEFAGEFPLTISIKNFSTEDIYEFLTRWPFQSNKEDNISRIYNNLLKAHSFREICRNPLILAMYVRACSLDQVDTTSNTRTEFYSKIIQNLLINRQHHQDGTILNKQIIKEDRERILETLALKHLLDPEQKINALCYNAAILDISEYFKCSKISARNIFFEIEKDTGLIKKENGEETFRFVHPTFVEFFAAKGAVKRRLDGCRKLINYHRGFLSSKNPFIKSRLIEVIPFAFGLICGEERAKLLDSIAKIKDNQLALKCFLEAKFYSHSYWAVLCESELNYLTQLSSFNWDAEWCRRLYLFYEVVNDSLESLSISSIYRKDRKIFDDLFKTLAKKNSQNLERIYSLYAKVDALAASRLADFYGDDLFEDYPRLIISNCDQDSLSSSMIKKIENEKRNERVLYYILLLAEASLRSRVIANWMYRLAPISKLEKLIPTLNKNKSNEKLEYFKPSFLRQCMYFALCDRAEYYLSDRLPLLSFLYYQFPFSTVPGRGMFWGVILYFLFTGVVSVLYYFNFETKTFTFYSITQLYLLIFYFHLIYGHLKEYIFEIAFAELFLQNNSKRIKKRNLFRLFKNYDRKLRKIIRKRLEEFEKKRQSEIQ